MIPRHLKINGLISYSEMCFIQLLAKIRVVRYPKIRFALKCSSRDSRVRNALQEIKGCIRPKVVIWTVRRGI